MLAEPGCDMRLMAVAVFVMLMTVVLLLPGSMIMFMLMGICFVYVLMFVHLTVMLVGMGVTHPGMAVLMLMRNTIHDGPASFHSIYYYATGCFHPMLFRNWFRRADRRPEYSRAWL